MAVPVIAGFVTTPGTGGDGLVGTKPADVAVGDLLVLLCCNGAAVTTDQFTNNLAGWTFTADAGTNVDDTHIGVFWRIADGTEGATVSITPNAADDWIISYLRITGIDTTTPVHKTAFAISNGDASEHTIEGVTTTIDNCLILYWMSFDGGDGAPFSVAGTGFAEDDEELRTGSYGGVSACFGHRDLAAQGASGTATVTASVSDGAAYCQIAIAPTAAGGSIVPLVMSFYRKMRD